MSSDACNQNPDPLPSLLFLVWTSSFRLTLHTCTEVKHNVSANDVLHNSQVTIENQIFCSVVRVQSGALACNCPGDRLEPCPASTAHDHMIHSSA